MAEIIVKVKVSREFRVFCDGTSKQECLDDIVEYGRLDQEILKEAYSSLEITEVIELDS